MICPCCQTDFPIEAGINDVAARNAVKRAFSLTQLGDLLLGYVQFCSNRKSGRFYAPYTLPKPISCPIPEQNINRPLAPQGTGSH